MSDDRPEWQRNANLHRDGDTIHLDLYYPRSPDQPKRVQVGLCDVRAADDIRISYDFERDGWKIEQASRFEFGPDERPPYDEGWKEVAFLAAWAMDPRGGEEA